VIICNIIVIPNKKPRFQKEFIWRGQGYDCKWDFISNTKYNLKWKMKINYNSKREDLEEEDQRQDERNVIL